MNHFFNSRMVLPMILALALATGCVTVAKQKDRATLAKKMMQFEPEPVQHGFLDEVHAIREGAQGGAGQNAGGGCGCN